RNVTGVQTCALPISVLEPGGGLAQSQLTVLPEHAAQVGGGKEHIAQLPLNALVRGHGLFQLGQLALKVSQRGGGVRIGKAVGSEIGRASGREGGWVE